ncbi:MAG: hydrolase, partial [Ruminococcus sp.]|nr:hydrolase [Ruminococcus sp.]
MMFFTADTHFGHANIVEKFNRPFNTVEEMNETLIKNWNDRITGSDTVFIMGDMFFRCADVES